MSFTGSVHVPIVYNTGDPRELYRSKLTDLDELFQIGVFDDGGLR